MYKPLPNGITVKESAVQGLGVFATKDFDADVILGIVHIDNKNFPHGYIRTALGAFYNHSDNPNCKNVWLPIRSITYLLGTGTAFKTDGAVILSSFLFFKGLKTIFCDKTQSKVRYNYQQIFI